MKNKAFKMLLCLLSAVLIFCTAVTSVIAEDKSVDEVQSIINGIIEYKFEENDCDNIQSLIDNAFCESAGDVEWYIIALSQYGEYDYSKYEAALIKYLDENDIKSASTRLKYSLALIAIDSNSEYITDLLNASIGEQGIMSWVYGLHILNNGYKANEYRSDDVIDKILSLQLQDGGWALNGEYGDVDVTAMTVQALAENLEREDVKTAVGNAIAFLASKQNAEGEFSSYGVCNPESASQVIVALSALDIDCATDPRFIKNGINLFDVVSKYRTENGGYSHISGGKVNENATSQALYSMIAYKRMQEGKSAFYIFDRQQNEEAHASSTESSTIVSEEPNDNINQSENNETSNYKLYIIIAIVLFSLIVLAIMVINKRFNKKNVVLLAVISVAVILLVVFVDFQSTDEHYENNSEANNSDAYVSITIRCDSVIGKAEHIPPDGIILNTVKISIAENATVYDVLLDATSKNQIHLETNGANSNVYIEGIANIYEFEYGDLSGWIYRVNGEQPSVSCGECELKAGDCIEWIYSLELGKELS